MKKLICMGDSMVFGFGVRRSECWVSLLHETGGFAAVNLKNLKNLKNPRLQRSRPPLLFQTFNHP